MMPRGRIRASIVISGDTMRIVPFVQHTVCRQTRHCAVVNSRPLYASVSSTPACIHCIRWQTCDSHDVFEFHRNCTQYTFVPVELCRGKPFAGWRWTTNEAPREAESGTQTHTVLYGTELLEHGWLIIYTPRSQHTYTINCCQRSLSTFARSFVRSSVDLVAIQWTNGHSAALDWTSAVR